MKKIENKKCKFLSLEGIEQAQYSDLINYCIRRVPAEGLNGDLILRIVSIHSSLEKMEFGDEDYKILMAFVKRTTWGQPHTMMDIDALKEIDQFIKDVCNME